MGGKTRHKWCSCLFWGCGYVCFSMLSTSLASSSWDICVILAPVVTIPLRSPLMFSPQPRRRQCHKCRSKDCRPYWTPDLPGGSIQRGQGGWCRWNFSFSRSKWTRRHQTCFCTKKWEFNWNFCIKKYQYPSFTAKKSHRWTERSP